MTEPTNEDLKSRIARLEAFFDGLGAAVFVGNRDRVLVDVNRRACRLLGYTREELVGKPTALIHIASEMPLHEALYRKGLSGQPYTVQYILLGKDGRQVPVEMRCEYVEVRGEPLLVALVQDITDREALLRQIVKEDRAGALGTFAEGVAHEFNNLLARILACAEDAGERDLESGAAQDVRTIINAAEEASRITERLLSYARRRPPNRQSVSIVRILEHTLQILEEELASSHVTVVREFEPLPDMMLDNVQMGQVFMNLITNARDAMPKGGELRISVRREGADAVIRFSDTGPGMTAEHLEDLFSPFVTTKGARARSDVPGMGLGLCVCDGIIAGHGGRISADSVLGKGTTFTIRLPIEEADAAGGKTP